MGMQTLVGIGGLGLSRGQIQKILIARALATRPRILVLDEPAGALQGAAQTRLLRALDALEMTRVVVSHDLRLLAGAGRLFELRDGHLRPLSRDTALLGLGPRTRQPGHEGDRRMDRMRMDDSLFRSEALDTLREPEQIGRAMQLATGALRGDARHSRLDHSGGHGGKRLHPGANHDCRDRHHSARERPAWRTSWWRNTRGS